MSNNHSNPLGTVNSNRPFLVRLALYWPFLVLWLIALWHLVIFNLKTLALTLIIPAMILPILRFIFTRKIFKNRFKAFSNRLHKTFFTAFGFLGFLFVFHASFLFSPLFTATMTVAGTVVAVGRLPEKLRAILISIFMISLMSLSFTHFSWLLIYFCAAYGGLFLVLALKKPEWIRPGAPLFLSLGAIALGLQLLVLFNGPQFIDIGRITIQAGVRPIFLVDDHESELAQAVGDDCVWVMENCDGSLIFGVRDRVGGLKIWRDNDLIEAKVYDASDTAALDCKKNRLWVGESETGTLHQLNSIDGQEVRRDSQTGMPGFGKIVLDEKAGILLAGRDDYTKIYRLDIATEKASFMNLNGYISDFAADIEKDALYTGKWGGWLGRYQFQTADLQIRKWFSDMRLGLELDKKGKILWVTRFFSGDLMKINAATLEKIAGRKLGTSLGRPVLTANEKLIFVTEFLGGTCYMLDADDLTLKDKRYFGPHLRDVTLSRDGKQLYATSSAGTFSWQFKK